MFSTEKLVWKVECRLRGTKQQYYVAKCTDGTVHTSKSYSYLVEVIKNKNGILG